MTDHNPTAHSGWTRRKMLKLGAAAATAAAAMSVPGAGGKRDAEAHAIPPGEWGSELYDKTLRSSMGYPWTRAVFQTPHLKESTFPAGTSVVHLMLLQMQNWFNGFEFSYGVRPDFLHVITAVYGPANAMTYDDYVWETYKIGEAFGVTDPATGAPAIRNPYYPTRFGLDASRDPNDPQGYYRDTSIQVMQQRGAIFLT